MILVLSLYSNSMYRAMSFPDSQQDLVIEYAISEKRNCEVVKIFEATEMNLMLQCSEDKCNNG